MLSIKNIDTYYGEVQALMDVSVEIGEKEIVAIIEMCIRDSSTRLSTYAFASIVLYLPLFLVCCSCAERNTDMPSCIFCPVQGNCCLLYTSHCEERNDKAGVLSEAGVENMEAVNRLLNQEIRQAVGEGMKVLYLSLIHI